MLGKTYNMTLKFETKNVELAKEKNFFMSPIRILVQKKLGNERGSKSFHVQKDKASYDQAINSPIKIKQNTEGKDCATIVISHDIWLNFFCDQRENIQSSMQRWQWR